MKQVVDSSVREAVEQAVALALKHGVSGVSASFGRNRGISVEWRDGRLDRVEDSTERGVALGLYVADRYSGHSTSDLRPEALDRFVADAVARTRLLEVDPYRQLTDPALYQGRAEIDLDLYDAAFEQREATARREEAQALEEAVRQEASDLDIISVTASVGDQVSEGMQIRSNGFEGESLQTGFSRWISMTIKDAQGRMLVGADGSTRCHLSDLKSIGAIARRAAERARNQRDAVHIPTGQYRVIVENRVMPQLLNPLLSPLSGSALQQKHSLWLDRVGTKIASPLLTLYDNPHIPRGLGASLWDSDGIATKRRPLIIEGVLQTYLIDQYYARKMGVQPTGEDLGDLEWTLGEGDVNHLAAAIGDGLLINRFLGGNSNPTTGEISKGCAGHVVRNGRICEPFVEANFADNLEHLFERLTLLGADAEPEGTAHCPSCVFDAVQVSGH